MLTQFKFIFKPGEPLFVLHPESQTRMTGESVILTAEAKGTEPLHFTWLHDDKVVEGACAPVLMLNRAKEADRGIYMCQVENQFGKIVSERAELQVGKWQSFIWGIGPQLYW